MTPEILRPTVNREVSLVSVQAWQLGYGKYMQEVMGWYYPALFHSDGSRVQFYHKTSDFEYFKTQITPRLVADDALFKRLLTRFEGDVEALHHVDDLTLAELPALTERIGRVMQLYMFIVSDKFIGQRPEAWPARHASEGILYALDEQILALLRQELTRAGLDSQWAPVLTLADLKGLTSGKIDKEVLAWRTQGYLRVDEQMLDESFADYCRMHQLTPPVSTAPTGTDLKGEPAQQGKVEGLVKIVRTQADAAKVTEGDILVTAMTNVTLLPAIKRAAAVVTDEGGITCHAAIAARELRKTTVIGTKHATSVLRDGDRVEVDGFTGQVKLLHRAV